MERDDACRSKIKIQWIPGHSDVAGNERADEAAKKATKLVGTGAQSSFRATVPAIRALLKDVPSDSPQTREIYSKFSVDRDKLQLKTRKDQALLSRLRAGQHYGLGAWRNKIDPEKSPRYKRCGAVVDDVAHCFQCDGTAKENFVPTFQKIL